MKKTEKDALKKAFDIPEPEHKKEFILLYREKVKKNKNRADFSVFFRYASTVAFVAFFIGISNHLNPNSELLESLRTDEQNTAHLCTTETTTETEIKTETVTGRLTDKQNISSTSVQPSEPSETTETEYYIQTSAVYAQYTGATTATTESGKPVTETQTVAATTSGEERVTDTEPSEAPIIHETTVTTDFSSEETGENGEKPTNVHYTTTLLTADTPEITTIAAAEIAPSPQMTTTKEENVAVPATTSGNVIDSPTFPTAVPTVSTTTETTETTSTTSTAETTTEKETPCLLIPDVPRTDIR